MESIDSTPEALRARKEDLLKEKDELQAIIAEWDAELDQAASAVQAAQESLSCLSKASITELKSFKTPSEKVQQTAEAVCTALKQPTDWASFKKLLANASFLQTLKNFDKDSLDDKLVTKLETIISKNDLENIEVIGMKSRAAADLAMWVVNIKNYGLVKKALRPTIERKNEAQQQLDEKNSELEQIGQSLSADKSDA